MEKKQISLKPELDAYISEHKIFTEKDKKNIRVKIMETRLQRKSPVRRINFIPILASCTAGFLFFLLLNSFIGDSFKSIFQQSQGTDKSNHQQDIQNGSEIEIVQTRTILDLNTLKKGDLVNDLEVEYVYRTEEDKEKFPNDNFNIKFNGEIALDGEFGVLTIDGHDKVVFYPDEKSLLQIPLVAGIEREPYVILHSPFENLIKFLQLEPGVKKKSQITIDHYRIYQNPEAKEQTYDLARLLKIKGNFLPEESAPTEVTKVYSILREELVPVYEKLVTTREENDLKGLEPMDIFQLYWQAFEYGNLEIKYFLLEGAELPDYQTFTEKVVEKNLENESKLFEKIKLAQNLKFLYDGDYAYVVIDPNSGEKAEFIKTTSGVWKVKY